MKKMKMNKKMNRRSYSVFSFLSVAALLGFGCQSTQTTQESRAMQSSDDAVAFDADRTAVLMVKGMTCPFCVQNVDQQLEAVDGVDRVKIDLSTGRVDVLLAEEGGASKESLESAVAQSGFTLDQIEMP